MVFNLHGKDWDDNNISRGEKKMCVKSYAIISRKETNWIIEPVNQYNQFYWIT